VKNIALVHDWVLSVGGAERTLAAMASCWPSAPLFTLIADRTVTEHLIPGTEIITSPLQHAWRWGTPHTALAPFMPSAIESFDFSHYDIVVSSSVLFSKGIITRPTTRHFSYCYSPARQLWDQAHTHHLTAPWWKVGAHLLRMWDSAASQRPDILATLSRTVQKRISTWYKRPSHIIYPPNSIDTSRYPLSDQEFYLCIGRDVPMKHLATVAQAFAKLGKRLIIVGAKRASTESIQWRGIVSDDERNRLYASCRALIVASDEDWGLTAIEAQSFGKPVIALRRGGATETMKEYEHGVFFEDPIVEAITEAVIRFESRRNTFDATHIKRNAQAFSGQSFAHAMNSLISTC
jgi:glycosyltransferase involved in cell wall biosynthesis